MPSYTYISDIPDPTHNPSDDAPDMKTNTNSIKNIINEDHFTFGTGFDGYHDVIRQPTGGGTQNMSRSGASATYTNAPSAIPGVNQILSGLYTPDATTTSTNTQLFNITGSGEISQLTGKLSSNNNDGWAWVGGILVQWGRVNFSTTTGNKNGAVTFQDRVPGAIPFPEKCIEVYATLNCTADISGIIVGSTIAIPQSGISKTSFDWFVFSAGAIPAPGFPPPPQGINGFAWFAIGR